MKKIKVLIVEDSKLMQKLLKKVLSADPEIEVVSIADDPLIARDLIKQLRPDVLTLDIMLPHMDGITFLKNLMRLNPLPTIMVSTLTEKGSAMALEALSLGAVDYLVKPTQHDLQKNDAFTFAEELRAAVKTAALANVAKSLIPIAPNEQFQKIICDTDSLKNKVIAIGASTGGIEAIETILFQLPKVLPPVIIVQHIRKEFNESFSSRISKMYGLSVVVPTEMAELKPGFIYIAPTEGHVAIVRKENTYFVVIEDTPAVNYHRPSIDVLFHSMAKYAGAQGIGVLLTGMGSDGAEGLKAMHDAGAQTIAQDKATSVIWGMPGSAVKLNAVDYVLPINEIPKKILQLIDKNMFIGDSEVIKEIK